jgi:hypothetical protein
MEEKTRIFNDLRTLLSQYAPPFQPKHDDERYYDLWSFKDLVIEGRKRKEVYFAGIIIQKDYVGFYFMPVYAEPEVKGFFKPELLSRLKGKSCFHIKSLTPELKNQIRDALAQGFEMYKQRGWVDIVTNQ